MLQNYSQLSQSKKGMFLICSNIRYGGGPSCVYAMLMTSGSKYSGYGWCLIYTYMYNTHRQDKTISINFKKNTSIYVLSSRVSSVRFSVDKVWRNADSFNAVLSNATTINGPASFNMPVARGNSIPSIDINDVAREQTVFDLKSPSASPICTGTKTSRTQHMIGLGRFDNVADVDMPICAAKQTALDGKAGTTTHIHKRRRWSKDI